MKLKINIILVAITLLSTNQLSAQRKEIDYSSNINQYDDNGQKKGFWRYTFWDSVDELYYNNGLRVGVFRSYECHNEDNTPPFLSLLSVLKDDYEVSEYHFGEEGHLLYFLKDFKENTYPMPIERELSCYPEYQCYCVKYHLNGFKESEGILICNYYYSDSEEDILYEYGEWKYYSDNGELIKTKYFR